MQALQGQAQGQLAQHTSMIPVSGQRSDVIMCAPWVVRCVLPIHTYISRVVLIHSLSLLPHVAGRVRGGHEREGRRGGRRKIRVKIKFIIPRY